MFVVKVDAVDSWNGLPQRVEVLVENAVFLGAMFLDQGVYVEEVLVISSTADRKQEAVHVILELGEMFWPF